MSETIHHDGRDYCVDYPYDEDTREPWKECGGHGVVSDWTTRKKRPGERVLNADSSSCSYRYYDVAETTKIAIRDGWGVKDGPREGETAKQYATRAVDADFEYLRAWCNDEWHYVIVSVKCEGEAEYLSGVEDSNDDYLRQVAATLIGELSDRLDAKRDVKRAIDYGVGI